MRKNLDYEVFQRLYVGEVKFSIARNLEQYWLSYSSSKVGFTRKRCRSEGSSVLGGIF